MSATCVVGLAMVSTWIMRVSGRSAARTAAGSDTSTKVASMPYRSGSSSLNRRHTASYPTSETTT